MSSKAVVSVAVQMFLQKEGIRINCIIPYIQNCRERRVETTILERLKFCIVWLFKFSEKIEINSLEGEIKSFLEYASSIFIRN